MMETDPALRWFMYIAGGSLLLVAGVAAVCLLASFLSVCLRKHKAAYDRTMRDRDELAKMLARKKKTGKEVFPDSHKMAASWERLAYASGARGNFDVVDDFVKDYGVAAEPVGVDRKALAGKTDDWSDRNMIDEFIESALRGR